MPALRAGITKWTKEREREVRRINAPFNDYRLICFDTAVRIYLNPTGSWVAFNPLDPSYDQPAHLGWGADFYKITMISGQYSHIAVEQRGIDVVVALFTPDGKKIIEVDSDQTTVGAEAISLIAEMACSYRIEARSAGKTAQTGRYQVKIEELREATAEDMYRVTAESVFREAEWLSDGTLEDRR